MGITWRDGVATVLAAAVAFVGLAVTNEWGWPMLGSFRAGTLVVGILGLAMCITGGSGSAVEAGMQDRGVRMLAWLGGFSFVLIAAGLITGSELVFMALVIVTLGMWLMATIRHAGAGIGAGRPAHHAAGA
jgi:hypothetical protein